MTNRIEPQSTAPRRTRVFRAIRVLAIAAFVTLVLAELTARYSLGLGDPPLFDRDTEIEYLYKPSKDYRRFGHSVSINSHSMRSPEFPTSKADPAELRVMVIGDSVVTGGARVDQSELATTLLEPLLRQATGRRVIVGNIAAASWGPPNQLAYLKKFGLFDADIVILVLNSGDIDDVPGLEPLGYAWPTRKPWLAVQEPARKLLEHHAPAIATALGTLTPSHPAPGDRRQMVDQALTDIVALVRAAPRPAAIGVLLFRARPEMAAPNDRLNTLRSKLDRLGLPSWDSLIADKTSAGGGAGFSDDSALFLPDDIIHPNAAGHSRLAELLLFITEQLLHPPAKPVSSETPLR